MNIKQSGIAAFILLGPALLAQPHTAAGQQPAPGTLCSDHAPQPPADHHKVKDKVIFEEITQGVFPGAMFPFDYAVNGAANVTEPVVLSGSW